jgi:hypothetical protein
MVFCRWCKKRKISIVLFHVYLDQGSGFGYYNFLSIISYCVDTSSLQAVTCCVSVYSRHLLWTFIQLYHYIEKESLFHDRLAGILCTVNAVNICVLHFCRDFLILDIPWLPDSTPLSWKCYLDRLQGASWSVWGPGMSQNWDFHILH